MYILISTVAGYNDGRTIQIRGHRSHKFIKPIENGYFFQAILPILRFLHFSARLGRAVRFVQLVVVQVRRAEIGFT